MLTTYHSNRLEALADALAERMSAAPLSPMTPETVVVPHRSMGHWLAMELADRHGVAANLELPFLGGLVWRLFRAHWPDLPEQSPFDRQALRWRTLGCLPALLEQPAFEPLRGYLADSDHPNGVKAYQLADRLAGLYDQYLVYRPAWITQWERGEDTHWQAALWRELSGPADARQAQHRARLLGAFLQALQNDEVDTDALPPRIAVFGLSSAPPAYLDLLSALAERIAVDVYVLNPCLHYWGDLVSERGLARLRDLWRRHGLTDASDYYSIGNPLLASLGRTGRELLELLHERSSDDVDCFANDGERETMLATVQRDMLYLRQRGDDGDQPPLVIAEDDRSIQLHACHSPMREVQVLHDRLRRMLADPGLQPRDVVVMTPDIDAYAPCIEAVFGNARGARHIPWSITDRSLPAVHPVIQVFTRLLDLPHSRLTASEVLSIIEVPAVHRRFGLVEAAIDRVRQWVRESGVRWGADAAHRAEQGLPDLGTHSWHFGLNRLLLGYAMDDDTALYHSIAPLSQVEGGEAAWLGGFCSFWDRLLALRTVLRRDHTPLQWQVVFNDLIEHLFLPANSDEELALQSVRDALDTLVTSSQAAAFDAPLPMQTVKACLEDALAGDSSGGGYLTGQVTFCAMVPMRSVPFQVVCLIGLNDRDFPRQGTPLAFDLMATAPRPGDRNTREDDRYLFLEALLSARRCLYLSYVGRCVRDNSTKLPSVLVDELMDTLNRGFRTGDGSPSSERLLAVHPLQPFSRRYDGDADPRIFSYADDWLHPADASDEATAAQAAPFFDEALPEPEEELRSVSLEGLTRFLLNPAAGFLRLRLGAHLLPEDASDEDSEPFQLDGLAAYQLRDYLLRQRLEGPSGNSPRELLSATGALPHGPFATTALDEAEARVEPLHRALAPLLEAPLEPIDVDLRLDGFTLTGWLTGIHADGLLCYRPAKTRSRDLLRLWLQHLAANAVAGDGAGVASRHLGEDGLVRLAALTMDEARTHLTDLLRLYWQGLQRPLTFFPDSALAYAQTLDRARGEVDALANARRIWQGNSFRAIPGERDDPSIAVVFRGREPLDDPAFAALAVRIFQPLLNHRG